MAVTYRVRDWDRHYENHETRKMKALRFCLLPNKHDGKGYRRVVQHPQSCEVFAAWVLILQVASKCPVRGTLADDDGPLTADDLAMKTGMPVTVFDIAFSVLSDPKIGWLACDLPESPGMPGESPGSAGDSGGTSQHVSSNGHTSNLPESPGSAGKTGSEGKGREGTRREGTGIDGNGLEGKGDMSSEDDPRLSEIESELVEAWNSIRGVTHVVAMNPTRKKAIKARMNDRVFRDRWREAIEKVRGSPFCLGDNDRNWRATFDWFLKPGTVAKAIEGQYDARRKNGTASETIDEYLATYGGQP